MERKNFFSKNKSLISFLAIEILILIAFNFANASKYISFVGVAVAVIALVFYLCGGYDKKSLFALVSPVFILFCISSIASFNSFSEMYGKFSFENITLFLALPSFFLLGYLFRKFKDIKPSSFILLLGAALAAITLFGLISTIINYGFFYTARFKETPYYFYNGSVYDVTKEMTWLNGLQFCETSISYGSLFALLSASFLPGLIFVSPKENRNLFLEILLIGAVGLITLLVIPNFKAILILLISSIGAVIYKFFKNNKKVAKIAEISLLAIVFLGVSFFVLAIVNVKTGYKFPGVLNKLFAQNEIMNKCNPIIEVVLKKGGENLLGIKPYMINADIINLDSHVFEVELLKEIGIIGVFIFLAFLFEMLYFLVRYTKKSKDDDHTKSIIMTFMFSFFIYETIENTILPFTHLEYKEMFLRSPLLLVIIFVFGFIYLGDFEEVEK